MVKKVFILLWCLLATIAVSANECSINSDILVELDVTIIDPTTDDDDSHKAPVQVPSVSLDDHTLYFFTPCDGCTLNLVDENDVVVYTLVIPAGTTSLVLPATLSGNFELQIIRGSYCFWGEITL